MKERKKAVEEAYNNDMEMAYYSTSDLPCKKHPSSSSVGICAYCLKDRLVKLACSDCGEQRLSSCSCSEISSNRNSCTVEVGSVGRVSFLIENEKNETPLSNSKPKLQEKAEEILQLRRSSSSCVEIKRSGFWRIRKLFRKKKEKECGKSVCGFDDKSETWVVDHVGVSRSRSLCSFRGGGLFGSDDGGDSIWSGARSSISAARSSGVNGGLVLESGRRSGFSEVEPRRSGFDGEKKDFTLESENGNDVKAVKKSGALDVDVGFNGVKRRIFSLRESDFKGMDESRFIDLKLDLSSESKQEFSAAKMGILADTHSTFGSMRGGDFVANELGGSLGNMMRDGVLTSGGSCRITVNDRGIKRGRKSFKGWRWIFRHHRSWGNGRKKDEDLMFQT
ncbi:Micronuclear linker histone polyprotein-like protein [Quillaja saponaria]|uniref:Micronuclear linker histone polyprotein-like protein n=1 Tax=Quillaja saponaria TaxID=32244 RepID=A0AAD7PFS8_QUISA|nr:Micronuclear linker histone polyprotein-like protein [Quillaja saponaria]